MLYKFSFLQIVVYLFVAPVARIFNDMSLIDYNFGIAFIFIGFFCLGGLIKRNKYLNQSSIDILKIDTEISNKWMLLIAWVLLCIWISFGYGLHNRRIGTDVAADLFASIPPYVLLIFRTLEISLAFLISFIILNLKNNFKSRLKNIFLAFFLVLVIILLGAGSSRTAIIFLLVTIVSIIQNKISIRDLIKIIKIGIFIAAFFFSAVTISRLNDSDADINDYLISDVLKRADGLEIVSLIIQKHGYQMIGINASAALNPVTSLFPFLERTKELKMEAQTTVKSIILEHELDSKLRDVNSFVILDSYYCGGILGVAIIAMLIGYLSKLVDKKIGLTSNWVFQILLVAITVNLVVLERETIGIIISIIRDWMLLCVVASLFLTRATLHKRLM
jgi:hypothetical protein